MNNRFIFSAIGLGLGITLFHSVIAPVFAKDKEIGKEVNFNYENRLNEEIQSLPVNPKTGNHSLIEMPGEGSLEIDTNLRDPITAVGACTAWITACLKPGERELDDCARSAPKCKTQTPWLEASPCCPSACFEAYKTKRMTGEKEIEALMEVYINDGNCFPGYKGRQGGPDKGNGAN